MVQDLPSKLYDFFTATADEREQESEKRPETQENLDQEDYFPERLSSLVQSLPSKIYDFFMITAEEKQQAEYERTKLR